ncbi:glycosyltransferase family 8 protein [Lachnospiraceae bacterium]|nr:glycosyltransferase family 8 protein [uncultured Schaedlerella sp.]NBI60426.1 glycosyltransferase family 8 protein [Lachnospiraceae bacterium]
MGNRNIAKTVIPVVFAADEKYVPYLGVALYSLIKNVSLENEYQIFILNTGLSVVQRKRLKQLETENVSINLCDVSELVGGKDIKTGAHFSQATAYRLLIDQLFPEYKKILYLDSDIIVRRDVAELYQTDIGENIFGAVRARLFPFTFEYVPKSLKVDIKDYFNAGILVINVDLFAEYEIGKKGMEMLCQKQYLTADQDVLNILSAGYVEFIDGRWNVEWEHLTGINGVPVIDDTRKGTLEYIQDPYIVHYTSHIKPWAHPEIELAEYFWMYARETFFYEEILFRNFVFQELWNHYLFPWGSVDPHKKVILYGFGNVGHIFYEQIKKTDYCNIIAICDKRRVIGDTLTVPLIHIEDIAGFDFDYIVIAVEQEKIAKEIRSDLQKTGISSDKIVWQNPIR